MQSNLRKFAWCIVSIWALLAFVSWHYDSTCGMFLSQACMMSYWDGIRWVVLLKWVLPYQTLLAGIAAIAAGAFVLWSQKIMIDENRQLAAAKTKAEFRASVAIVRAECIHVADHLYSDDLRTSAKSLEFSRSVLPKLASFDARLHHITTSVIHRLENALREKEKGSASTFSAEKFNWYASIGRSFSVLLKEVLARIDQGNPIDVNKGSFDGSALYEYLQKQGQTPAVIFELGEYFEWPAEYDDPINPGWNIERHKPPSNEYV